MDRKLAILMVFLMALLPMFGSDSAVAQQREQDIKETPVAVSVFTAADLKDNLRPTDARFEPLGSGGAGTSSLVRVLATAGITWRLADPLNAFLGRWDVERQEVLSGPQGRLFGSDAFNIRSIGTPDFYGGQQVVTGYLAKVEPLPEFTDEEIFEISLAFTWFGEEVLTESIYEYDPLMGYTYTANTSIIGGEAIDGFAKVVDDEWFQYANPLWGFDFTTTSGEYYLGFVLPGIPEAAGFTLSYSPELSLDPMIAQHVPVVPIDGGEFPTLGLTWNELVPDLQLMLVDFENDVADGDEPPAGQDNSTTGQITTESPTVVEDPESSVVGDTGRNTNGQTATPGSSSFPSLGLLFVFTIALVLGTGIWWFWRRSTNDPRVLAHDDEVATALLKSLAVPQHLLPEPGKAWWLTDLGAAQVPLEELNRRLIAEGRMIPYVAVAAEPSKTNEAQQYQIRGWHLAALDHRGRLITRPMGEISRFSLAGRQSDDGPLSIRMPEPVTLDSRGRVVSQPRSGTLRRFRLRTMVHYVDESGRGHIVEDLDPEAPATAEKVAIWISEDERVLILAEDPKSLLEELTERWPEIDGDDDGPVRVEENVIPS